MPLSEEERRCVLGACEVLGHVRGGEWAVVDGDTLDDLNPNTKSPEVLVSNQTTTAAIEVTELRGGFVWNAHGVSWRVLQSILQPSSPGHFLLVPADDFRLPISKASVGQLKAQIEAAARTLHAEGDVGAVRVPRAATVSLVSGTKRGYVYCCHHSMGDVLRQASNMIRGAFMLVDCGELDHSFVTAQGRERAAEAIAEACRRRLVGEITRAEWDEEWELRLVDSSGTGVEILCVTDAVSVPHMVAEDVTHAVAAKHRKFAEKRWADLHVLVMDARVPLATGDYGALALSHVPDQQLLEFDLIILTHGEGAELIWENHGPKR